ncbi:MAG: class II histone deacetylase [Thiolinea sp.]
MNTTAFLSDERCFWHSTGEHALVFPVGDWVQPPSGAGHAESAESKRRFRNLLEVSGLASRLDCHSAAAATEEDLRRIHTENYLQQFKALSDDRGGALHPVAPFGKGSYDIARLSAGLAKQAVADVLSRHNKNAYALSRPPGHHCLADSPMGFCLLANIPIAIEAAKADFGVEKVAVVDWDAHHGNGTQSIYYERNDVLTISLHQENAYPADSGAFTEQGEGAGRGHNLNINMLPGAGGELYHYALDKLVIPALQRFQPDLMIIASGFDGSKFDPLARLQLLSADFRSMTEKMLATAEELCEGRLVMVHEGGYAEAYVPFCGLAVMEALSGEKTTVSDNFAQAPTNQRFINFHCELIDEMAAALKN